MIKKNYKDVHWIHKGTDNIDKVYKGTDLVFEQGYTREQTGVPPITTTYQAIGKDLKDYKIYGNGVQGELPDTYQQVEYIESTGTQYIDTGYIPDNINGYKIQCEVCPTELSNRYCILSGYNATNSLSLEITQQNKARAYFYYGSAVALDKIFGTITSNKNTLIIEYLNGRFTRTVNGETSSETINLLGTANESMYMFVDRQLRYSVFYKPLKMYKCKLYNNNYLIRNFVPCYRKSDNEVGLYDLVSNTFFTNSGTGTFNKGADTPKPDVPIEIESVGDLVTDTNDVNYGKYKIPVIARGKNFFDKKNMSATGTYTNVLVTNNNGNLTFNGTSSGFGTFYLWEGILEAGSYVISSNNYGSANRSDNFLTLYIGTSKGGKNIREALYFRPVSLVLDKKTYIYMCFKLYTNSVYNIEIENIQLETGTSTTPYEPYFIPITNNIYLDEPLRKIGDYADYIDFNNKKIVRNIGKKVLDGSENWSLPSAIISGYSSYRVTSFFPTAPVNQLLSSHFECFPKTIYNTNPIQNKLTSYAQTNQLVVVISNSIADSNNQTSTTNFTTWLSNNNVDVYFSQDTVEETITLPNIPTIKGTTIFEIDTEIQPSSMYIKYKSK